jgi:trigger factor
MKSTWTIVEKSKGDLKVTIEGDLWTKAQDKAFKKLAANVNIPGFRKGKAPLDMVKKQVSEQSILIEAVENIAQEALNVGLAEHNLAPITRPELGVDAVSAQSTVLNFSFLVKPEVTLGEYKGLKVEKAKVKVTKKDVDAKLEELRQQFAELVVVEGGKVKASDTAIIDFEGFKDGVAFEGGKGENFSLEIGSNSFIPGFEDAIIGMSAGEEKDIDLSFPENYQAEHLAGQPVVFKVKVNEIKRKELPALDDAFAKEIKHKETETLEDLKKKFEEELLEQKTTKADEDFKNEVLTKVVDSATVEIPDVLVDEETQTMIEDFRNRLSQQGFTLEQYFQITGQNLEELSAQMRVDALGKVKVRLVLDALANAEKIEVKAEDIEEEYATIAKNYSMDIEKVKQLASVETIAYDVRLRKAYDFIFDNLA